MPIENAEQLRNLYIRQTNSKDVAASFAPWHEVPQLVRDAWEEVFYAASRPRGVYADIVDQRDRQDKQWGGQAHDDTHASYDWCSYIQKFWDRAVDSTFDLVSFEENMIHIAALAVAAVESSRRKRSA